MAGRTGSKKVLILRRLGGAHLIVEMKQLGASHLAMIPHRCNWLVFLKIVQY